MGKEEKNEIKKVDLAELLGLISELTSCGFKGTNQSEINGLLINYLAKKNIVVSNVAEDILKLKKDFIEKFEEMENIKHMLTPTNLLRSKKKGYDNNL